MLSALKSDFSVDVLVIREGSGLEVAPSTSAANEEVTVTATVPSSPWPWLRFRSQAGASQAIESALGHRLADYDLVVGRYVWPVCQLVLPKGLPVLVDLDDWRFLFSRQLNWRWENWPQRLSKGFAHAFARRQLPRFAAAFAVLARDAAEVAPILPVTLLPNVPPPLPPDDAITPIPGGGYVLFVGSLWYGPNAQAIDAFLDDVWPTVREVHPSAQLLLVGSAPPARLKAWSSQPGVSAPGFVDDLAAAYRGATVVIAPQLSGGGSSIKVLEAMGHGRPCVVSELVATAYADCFANEREFLVAADGLEVRRAVLGILGNPAGSQAMVERARTAVRQRFDGQVLQQQVRQTAAAVLAGKRQ